MGVVRALKKEGLLPRIVFINCILDGVACEAPLQHGLVVQKMMEGLLHSAEIGKPISFE